MYSAWFSLRSLARTAGGAPLGRWRPPGGRCRCGQRNDGCWETGRCHRPHPGTWPPAPAPPEQPQQAGVGRATAILMRVSTAAMRWSSWRTSATRSVASCQQMTAAAPAGVTAASSPAARLAVRLRRAPPGTRSISSRWSRLMVWVRTATTSWRRLLNRCSRRGSDPAPWLGRCRARGWHSFRQCSESGGGKCLVWY
jgi:hypothetical protein